jgi:phosphoglycolate phosphatase
LVTNKPEALSELLLDSLGVRSFFSAIVGGDTCHSGKPDPVTLEKAAELSGFDGDRKRVFHIGDSAGDQRCAKAYGATAIWCAWGYLDDPPTEPSPDLEVAEPKQLFGLIKSRI